MKKGWKVVIKIVDAIVWLWSKIKPSLPEVEEGSNKQLKK